MSLRNNQPKRPSEGYTGNEALRETPSHRECAKECLDYHRKFDPDRYFVPTQDHLTYAGAFSKYETLSDLGPVAQHRGAYCTMMSRLFKLGKGNPRVSETFKQNGGLLKNLAVDYRSILRSPSFKSLKADDLKVLIRIFSDCSDSLKKIPNEARWEKGARAHLSKVGDRFDDPEAITNMKNFVNKALLALNKLHQEKEKKEKDKPKKKI